MDKQVIDDFERERDFLIKELDFQRELAKSNFLIFKQKVISTGGLLAEFHRKSQELEALQKILNELKLKLEMCYGETGSLRIQLEKALLANEPLKKTIHRFENEKTQLECEVQQLKNILKKKEGEVVELKKVSYSSQIVQDTLKKTKCEMEKEHKRDKKKVLNQAKLIDQLNKKLQELRAKSKEDVCLLRQLERENAKLKERRDLISNNTKKKDTKKSNQGKASHTSPGGVISHSASRTDTPINVKHFEYKEKRKIIKKVNREPYGVKKNLSSPTSSGVSSSGSSTDSDSDALNGLELQQFLEHTNSLMPDIYKTIFPVLLPIPPSPKSVKCKDQSGLSILVSSEDSIEATKFTRDTINENSQLQVSAATTDTLNKNSQPQVTATTTDTINENLQPQFTATTADTINSQPQVIATTTDSISKNLQSPVTATTTDTIKENSQPQVSVTSTDTINKNSQPQVTAATTDTINKNSQPQVTATTTDTISENSQPQVTATTADTINKNSQPQVIATTTDSISKNLQPQVTATTTDTINENSQPQVSVTSTDTINKNSDPHVTVTTTDTINDNFNELNQAKSKAVINQFSNRVTHSNCSILSPLDAIKLSPLLSPIPISPGRSFLTPIVSPLSQSTHHTFNLSNKFSSINSHFIPIISHLPQTPLPESVSPLPLSPTILSPPLIKSSALLKFEDSSVFAPKPQIIQLADKIINGLNVEQSTFQCNIRKPKVKCVSFAAKRALLLNDFNNLKPKNAKTENQNSQSSTIVTIASTIVTTASTIVTTASTIVTTASNIVTTASIIINAASTTITKASSAAPVNLVKSNFIYASHDSKVVDKNNLKTEETIMAFEKQNMKRKCLDAESLCKNAKISKNNLTNTFKGSSEMLLNQHLVAALSDKVNTSAASLSKAIVKLVVSCEVFLLPVILKLIQTTLCSECIKNKKQNCKLCKSNGNFFDTCNPLSLLTQVLTETEYSLLHVLNELKKLPHMKKLFIFLKQQSHHAVFEGLGKRLSCEILALCRLYAVVSRITNKLDELIYFLYILAYDQVPHTNFAMFFITCYSIWPSLLFQSNLISQNESNKLEYRNVQLSPMSGAFQILAFYEAALKDDANSLKILEYLFSINVRVTIQFLKEYVFELFYLLCEPKLSYMLRNTDTKELNMCPYAYSTAKALALVCTRVGWEWTYNTLIQSTIIEYLIQGFTNENIHLDNICILIRLVGILCQYGHSCGYSNFNELSDFLVTIFKKSQSLPASVSESVQVATVFALMDIVPSHPCKIKSLIEKWIQDTKEFLVPAYITENIQHILRRT